MKKTLSILLVLLLAMGLLPSGALAANPAVVMSPQNLRVNGKRVACEKYNIDGSNYFKLRDIAYVLSGTGSSFSVSWDGESRCISIRTGEEYEPNGTELDLAFGDKSASAAPSEDRILVNGEERTDLSAYKLEGNNFYKLRDLGDALGFRVDYDRDTNTAIIISRAPSHPAPWLTVEAYSTDEAWGGTEHSVSSYDERGFLLSSVAEAESYSESSVYRYDELDRMTEYVYRYSTEEEDGTWEETRTTVYEYDKWGQPTKTVTTAWDSGLGPGVESPVTEMVYTYDGDGNRLREDIRSPYGSSAFVNAYDARGFLIRTETYSDGSLQDTVDYVRDDEGRELSRRRTLADGTVAETYAYEYADGVLMKETYAHDDYRRESTYTYDERGNVLSVYSDTTDWDNEETNTYDEEGRLLEHVFYNGADLFSTSYVYDAEGRVLREAYDSPDDFYTIEYTYDGEGNPLTEDFTGSAYTYRTEYAYDRAERRQTRNTVYTYPKAEELVMGMTELTLAAGEEFYLSCYFLPYNAPWEHVGWSSSDESVVIADGYGKLTAVGAGTAVVTAESESGLTASCAVTVAGEKYRLTVSDSELRLKAGETAVIHCSVEVTGDWLPYSIRRDFLDGENTVSTSWGEFAGNDIDLTVYALTPGTCTLQLSVFRKNDDGSEIRFEPVTVTVTVEETEAEQLKPGGGQSAEPEKQLTVDGRDYALGMTEGELTALAGQPAETLASTAGYTYYVFGTETYLDFLIAGVYEGRVVMLASGGKAFSYMDAGAGSTETLSGTYVTAFRDKNDGGILHAVALTDYEALPPRQTTISAEQLAGESKVNFHMTNAFRVYHGLTPFLWSSAAAEASRLHSQDMADQNYFDHSSLDGRSPWDRMEAQGIRWRSAAENISAGRSSGIDAYNGWVNSSGHRRNMLGGTKYLGVGAGCSGSSDYAVYMTQDFYS